MQQPNQSSLFFFLERGEKKIKGEKKSLKNILFGNAQIVFKLHNVDFFYVHIWEYLKVF